MRDRVDLPDGKENACTGGTEPGRWHLVIPGRLPGLNEYIEAERRNRYKAAKIKADAQNLVTLCIRQQLRGVRLSRPVRMRYTWIEPNRRRDPSNICGYGRKVIEDALVTARVLEDDGWDEMAGFSDAFDVDRENPRIVVEIIECPDITTQDANTTRRTARAGRASKTTTGSAHSSDAASGTDDPAPKRGRLAKTTKRRKV